MITLENPKAILPVGKQYSDNVKAYIELDIDRINEDGVYSSENALNTLYKIYKTCHVVPGGDGWIYGSNAEKCMTQLGSVASVLMNAEWFAKYVKKFDWYEKVGATEDGTFAWRYENFAKGIKEDWSIIE
jgi:hypothetical protein